MSEEKNKPNKKTEESCPLCNVSEETVEKLKEAARQKKRQESSKKNGGAKNN